MLDVEDEVSLLVVLPEVAALGLAELLVLPVPLAPMLDVLGLVELFAVLELVLGVVVALVLGEVELLVLGEVPVLGEALGAGVPVEPPVLLSVFCIVDGVPPPPAVDESLLVCAIAKPPMASAAAAANVVSVFLVVVMSFAP